MGNKYPMAVVTDGDLSMREVIKQVFPYATYGLCAWHLHRNACEKVKNSGFLYDFKKLIYANKDTLLEFINNMETGVSHYRNNERVAEFNSKYTDPVLVTSLPTLEDFAANTFTRNMFRERDSLHAHIACLKHQHVEVIPECLVRKRWMKNAKSDFMKSNVDDPSDYDKVLKCRLGVLGVEYSRLMDIACKNSSDFVEVMNDVVNTISKLQKRGHYNKSCPNVPGRIPKKPIDNDTEKNISSHLDILTKCKRHDSVKNQQKMEKDRNIGGGTAPTSAAKSAFSNQVKTSSLGPDIPFVHLQVTKSPG
ncbi:hypothetical protein Ahy_A07g033061 [Arachis hypogaea]|uniref:Uncharacterized protein n=1 Tax=Arachis hypogaea TaxID=3818 RepID=A0A445C884_ARAHY|nr:hypothetical protein Ahy_A07g033061 [Arachis hypogaea]